MTDYPNQKEIDEAIKAFEEKTGETMSESSREWFSMAMSSEPLDPELVPYVDPEGPLGPCLKHPLVFEIGGIRPGIANMALRQKKEHLAKAEQEGQWHSYVFLHERPYRAQALLRIVNELCPDISVLQYAKLVASVWTDSENIWQNGPEWEELFESLYSTSLPSGERHIPEWVRRALMTEADYAKYLEIVQYSPITVYRGCIRDFNEDGLSWTRNRNVARFFARRFADVHDNLSEAVILVAEVDATDVIAYFDEGHRGEEEIVLAPHATPRIVRAEEP